MLLQVLYLILSMIGLYFGAEFTLESAEKIGKKMGMSPLMIGLLIVGFGTSLPEFFVSQLAAFRGYPEISLGNVIGSNIANTFLVLGLSSMVYPLSLKSDGIRDNLFFHLIVHCFILIALSAIGITWVTGVVLLSFFVIYLYLTITNSPQMVEENTTHVKKLDYVLLAVGFAMLYASGELLVYAGSNLGKLAGIPTYVISVIFIAFGTSFPELVTAILACYKRKDTDIIVGNILGSNIFNLSLVLGSVSFYPNELKDSYWLESTSLVVFSIVLLVLYFLKKKIFSLLGFLFLITYGAFIFYWL